jgi:pyruvate dehydrogenase E2 component (dihydrolipoamide acetyltransferase)
MMQGVSTRVGVLPPAENLAYAGPFVRKLARELGVDLALVSGSGDGGRIQMEDVHRHVQEAVRGRGDGVVSSALAHFDEADVTELEALRQRFNAGDAGGGVEITMLSFVIKAVVATLRIFPAFSASLDDGLLFDIGFAAEGPNGLSVPVICDADRKGISGIAREVAELSGEARDGRIRQGEMGGGCFSIVALGGVGFVPSINASEVAVLGVAGVAMRPVWNGEAFTPRLILPLALAWDSRVADSAGAARFLAHLSSVLEDFRQILL